MGRKTKWFATAANIGEQRTSHSNPRKLPAQTDSDARKFHLETAIFCDNSEAELGRRHADALKTQYLDTIFNWAIHCGVSFAGSRVTRTLAAFI